MAAPQGPTALTLSGIVDGQEIDAADVTIPLNEAAAAIDEARQTVAVSSDDGVLKYLSEALAAGSGISLTVENTGGSKTIRIAASSVEVGTMQPWFGSPVAIPSGYLLCDGQHVSMKDYRRLLDLFIAASVYYGTTVGAMFGLYSQVAFTADAATDKLLAAGHGLTNGTVMLVFSTGTLPAGLNGNTIYYVVNAAPNDFQVSLTEGGAPVDLTSAGTGTHYYYTRFRVPDMRGRFALGLDAMLSGQSANRVTAAAADTLGGTGGAETHTLTVNEMPGHTHSIQLYAGSGGTLTGPNGSATQSYNNGTGTTGSAGGGQAHNNMPPYLGVLWIIKT